MMSFGYEQNLYMLAFDHRASFTRDLFGLAEAIGPVEQERVSDAKMVIYEGFLQALDRNAPRDAAGVLVDEAFGSEVMRRAKADGVMVAMPAERSGQQVFDFEYGDAFGDHIERFDPTFTKVLVRYNPDDPKGNETQQARLRRLSDWLHARGRLFLFELLVPATSEQMSAVDSDIDRYDRDLRPGLMIRTIAELQRAGVEPDIWKIEGLGARQDCVRVVAQARANGRNRVACVVLGRGASDARVTHWLQIAATVSGFQGFAVGRTIWQEALEAYRDGVIGRDEAIELIATRYLHTISTFSGTEYDSPASS